MALIKINATNDINGNPRRACLALDEVGRLKEAFDEGFSGYNAVPKRIKFEAQRCLEINVEVKQYKEFLRQSDQIKLNK